MKKIHIFLVLFFLSLSGFSQDTLFLEDFNNNRNQWPIITNANNQRKIKNGSYIFENKLKKGAFESRVAVLIPENFDFEINLLFTKTKGPNERANGLIWGSNGNERFSFVISGNGKFSIDKFEKGQWHDFYPWTATSYIKTSGPNHLKVRKAGDYYLFYINNKQVGQIKYLKPFGNQIGITVSRETRVQVDKIWVLKFKSQPYIPVKIFAQTKDSSKVSNISEGQKILSANEKLKLNKEVAVYKQYLQYHPTSIEALQYRANVYLRMNEYQKAITDYNTLIAIQPNNPDFLNQRADAYIALKQYKNAIRDLEKIKQNNPKDIERRIKLVMAFIDNKDYKSALSEVKSVETVYEPDASLYNLEGEIYVLLENQNQAIKSFEAALKMNPEFQTAKLNLERIKNRLVTENPEIIAFSDLIKKMPLKPDNYYYRAKEREKALDEKGALEDYTQAINLNYSNADVYLKRAAIYQNSNKQQLAIADYSKYLEKVPWNPTVLEQRADLYLISGNEKLALNDYTSALKYEPTKAIIYSKRAEIYERVKNYDLALVDYKKAMDLDSTNINATYKYGKILYEVKQKKEEACVFIQQAVNKGNKDAVEFAKKNCNTLSN